MMEWQRLEVFWALISNLIESSMMLYHYSYILSDYNGI